MIKVFRLSDLIKYFIRFIVPIILIIICLKIITKRQEKVNVNSNSNIEKITETKNEDIISSKENEKINNTINTKENSENTNSENSIQTNSKLENLNKKYESSKLKSKFSSLFKKEESNNEQSKNENNESKDNSNKTNSENNSNKNKKISTPYYFCLNNEMINLKNIKDETKISFNTFIKKIVQNEFTILSDNVVKNDLINNSNDNIANNINNNIENIDNTNSNSIDNITNNENTTIQQAEENVKTEVTSNAISPRFNYNYNGIKIYNSTKYQLTNEMLDTSNFNVNKNKILIYHTHTCESYTPTEKFNYTQTGNFRTTDLNFSVVRVGEELKKQLESYNIQVIQSKTYHDYPSYNGSYSRSLVTANKMLSENKDAEIVIDLHRDAIADSSYAPKVKIGDEYVSQLMFVIGTDIANRENSHWNDNLKFAVKIQQKANEMYPRII